MDDKIWLIKLDFWLVIIIITIYFTVTFKESSYNELVNRLIIIPLK